MYGMPCECMHGLKGGVQKLRRTSLARAVYDNPTPPCGPCGVGAYQAQLDATKSLSETVAVTSEDRGLFMHLSEG